MIDLQNALTLIAATAILGLSPGPAVFATIARAIGHPFHQTLLFIAGIVLADFVFAVLAMEGFAVLVSKYDILFLMLRFGGAAYLLYLGTKVLFSRSSPHEINAIEPETGWKLVASGFLLTAGNPKDLLFFVSFLPAFIDVKQAETGEILTAALLIVITFVATLSFYALLASWARNWLSNPRTSLWLNRLAGGILILVGLTIIYAV
ncbi:MAG: LysE family translocator [Pseudobdellovibrionaceae bacterium]